MKGSFNSSDFCGPSCRNFIYKSAAQIFSQSCGQNQVEDLVPAIAETQRQIKVDNTNTLEHTCILATLQQLLHIPVHVQKLDYSTYVATPIHFS